MGHKPKTYKKFVAPVVTATLVAQAMKPKIKVDNQLYMLTREQKVNLLINYTWVIEDVILKPLYFENYSDDELDKEILSKEKLLPS